MLEYYTLILQGCGDTFCFPADPLNPFFFMLPMVTGSVFLSLGRGGPKGIATEGMAGSEGALSK